MNGEQAPHSERVDPFLEEIQQMKREAWDRSGRNLDEHLRRLMEIQRKFRGKVVKAPSRDSSSGRVA